MKPFIEDDSPDEKAVFDPAAVAPPKRSGLFSGKQWIILGILGALVLTVLGLTLAMVFLKPPVVDNGAPLTGNVTVVATLVERTAVPQPTQRATITLAPSQTPGPTMTSLPEMTLRPTRIQSKTVVPDFLIP